MEESHADEPDQNFIVIALSFDNNCGAVAGVTLAITLCLKDSVHIDANQLVLELGFLQKFPRTNNYISRP